jgi:hypothetical protein
MLSLLDAVQLRESPKQARKDNPPALRYFIAKEW